MRPRHQDIFGASARTLEVMEAMSRSKGPDFPEGFFSSKTRPNPFWGPGETSYHRGCLLPSKDKRLPSGLRRPLGVKAVGVTSPSTCRPPLVRRTQTKHHAATCPSDPAGTRFFGCCLQSASCRRSRACSRRQVRGWDERRRRSHPDTFEAVQTLFPSSCRPWFFGRLILYIISQC